MWQRRIEIATGGQGLYPITDEILSLLPRELPEAGLLNIFIQHTSASLLIQENADPTARQDLEEFFRRLAPEGEPWHQHTLEGPDDTTSHLKSAISQSSLIVPIEKGQLALGTWQGIYLFEHRNQDHRRSLLLTLFGA